jgi:signal transduction histidine kinase
MKRILILIEHQQNRKILSQALAEYYQVLTPGIEEDFNLVGAQMLKDDFDLCFIDYGAIHALRSKMLARRKIAIPTYLPFVFPTTLQDIGLSTDHLEMLIDDIIYLPVEKAELKTKIRILMRSRSYSLQLQAAKEKLNQNLAQERESNLIKSRFVSTVSHEFRNPLNSISGMAQILETYGDKLSAEKKTEVLQQLRRNVTKMTNLVDDVLTISQKDLNQLRFDPAPLDLEKFCQGLVREVQTAFNDQQVINLVYQGQQKYNLDSNLLDHILTNLLTNACKYSPTDTEVEFNIYDSDSNIVFTVGDRGIGIPPEDMPNLFNPFYRASNSKEYQGTGLGLAIAKEYVELHQGKISVESELKKGTIFTVTIPLVITN